MSRLFAATCLGTLFLGSCGHNIQTKEKVQEAIVKRLQTTAGLDLNSLDLTTTSVRFDKSMAYATVAFHSKGDTNLNSGMQMNYTLEDRDSQWVVVKVGNSAAHAGGSQRTDLPSGHPAIGSQLGQGHVDLPPGHPAIRSDMSPKPSKGSGGQPQ